MRAKLYLSGLLTSLLISACSTDPGEIVNRIDLGPDEFFTTGARQRVITNSELSPNAMPGLVDPLRIVCTEPSPDVAIAVANSFSAGLSIFGYGSGSVTGAEVQALAQLVERTASIQLLRDKMYQTCLAYSNGAISGTTYSLVMSRLDDTIVSLLLGETAGGAFGRKLAALGTEAEAEATASLVGLPAGVQGIEAASNEVALAQKNVDEKTEALRAAEAKVAGQENPPQEDRDAVTTANKELADAKAERDRLLSSLKSQAETMSKSLAKSSNVIAGGGLAAKTDPFIADTLARMQEEFLHDDFADFFVSACMIELGVARGKGVGPDEDSRRPASLLANYCVDQLPTFIELARRQYVTLETKRLETKLERARAEDEKASAIAERAKAEAERAKETTERAKALTEQARQKSVAEFVKAVTACNGITDADLKGVCIGKLPNLSN